MLCPRLHKRPKSERKCSETVLFSSSTSKMDKYDKWLKKINRDQIDYGSLKTTIECAVHILSRVRNVHRFRTPLKYPTHLTRIIGLNNQPSQNLICNVRVLNFVLVSSQTTAPFLVLHFYFSCLPDSRVVL